MKKTLTSLAVAAVFFTLALPFAALPAAAIDANSLGANYAVNVGLGNTDPRDIAARIINIALSFLGILALIIILLGGFKWMTAAGNEDQVEEAKKVLISGIIGLVIILASWGIAQFVLANLISATQG